MGEDRQRPSGAQRHEVRRAGAAQRQRHSEVHRTASRAGVIGHVTLDGGQTYRALEVAPSLNEIVDLQYDSVGHLYGISGRFGGRPVRSDDYGLTWRPLSLRADFSHLRSAPDDNALLLAIAGERRLIAMDTAGTVRYETTVPSPTGRRVIGFYAPSSEVLVARSVRTLSWSADGGRTWDASDESVREVIGPGADGRGLVVTEEERCTDYDVGLSRTVFAVTDDAGASWAKPAVRSNDLQWGIGVCDDLGDGEFRCLTDVGLVVFRPE